MLKVKTGYKYEPVQIDGVDYEIRELNGVDAERWDDVEKGFMEFDFYVNEDKTTGYKPRKLNPTVGNSSLLISMCLFKKTESGFENVPQDLIGSWVHTAQDALFDKCQEINCLGKYKKK